MLEKPLVWLCRYRIPFVFDFLFLCHFAYYALRVEHISLVQFLYHVRTFALRPFFKGKPRKVAGQKKGVKA